MLHVEEKVVKTWRLSFLLVFCCLFSNRKHPWRMDQFEVSECTLSGPSVGNITEDGVVASCHPPLPWNRKSITVSSCSINAKTWKRKTARESKYMKTVSWREHIAAATLVCCRQLCSSMLAKHKFVVSPDQWRRCLKSASKQISAAADSLSLHILLSVRRREGSSRVRWGSWVEVTRPGLSQREPVLASLTLLCSRRDLAFTGSIYVTTNKAKG